MKSISINLKDILDNVKHKAPANRTIEVVIPALIHNNIKVVDYPYEMKYKNNLFIIKDDFDKESNLSEYHSIVATAESKNRSIGAKVYYRLI